MPKYEIDLSNQKIAIIGLGYVGLPLAVAFSEKTKVIGFDVDENKINSYKNGIDVTQETGDEVIKNSTIEFTSDEKSLKNADYLIIAVPTPITIDKIPNFKYIESASEVVGRNMKKGSVIIYESTVYPGVTEEICVPILKKESNLKYGEDFKIGYSPERINPGDNEHRIDNTIKIVSGMDEESLDIIASLYETIVTPGVYKAESIKVAEAAKIVENAQRDINIAFMNELSIVFNKMDISTAEVLKAAGTKWNFINFTPGLVGGHCIGVDPYYFIYKAKELGYHSQLITAGRKINDGMSSYVVENIVKKLIQNDKNPKGADLLVLGITFKENCSDVRNSKIAEVILSLKEFGINITIVDSQASSEDVENEYRLELSNFYKNKKYDGIVIGVKHSDFEKISLSELKELSKGIPLLFDIKGIYNKQEAIDRGFVYWVL
ncbi:MAG: nucleotide sugar dehydrogenase [Methanobrevibacter sp.]|nr:nucleotide sugar dehydrogenase [Methanobrevibacter sp.]